MKAPKDSAEVGELLELLWANARNGRVTAQKILLDYYQGGKQAGAEPDEQDPFDRLDELAPRRQARRRP